MSTTGERLYRFAPIDRTGWILGLSGSQCGSLAAGVLVAGALLRSHAPAPVVGLPVVVAVAFAFAAWDGRSLHEWAPIMLRYMAASWSGSRRWTAPVPRFSGTAADLDKQPALPPFLGDISLLDAGAPSWCPAAYLGVGVVLDRHDQTLSASVPVGGREFSLVERAEQERIVQLWGDVLAGFCTERGPVGRVRVTEWAALADLSDHDRFVDASATVRCDPEAVLSYRELLADSAPAAVRHEVLVTVTIDRRRLRGARGTTCNRDEVALHALLEELRLLSARLDAAGLVVGTPLTIRQLAEAIRLRLDPGVRSRLATRSASLAQLAGLVSRWNIGPLACETTWSHLRTDGSFHRTYWVAEWPRLEVPPNWLESLLLHAGSVRTFSLDFEPVPPSRSQRRIDRDATRLAADEEHRTRTGFRIGARHRRAQSAVLEREAELVGGYTELEFAGFVTVTALDEHNLARACAEYEQVAAQAGLELRALDGRHDLAFATTLPLGRGLAPRRLP